jgi:Ca-activated chloride channel homolog
MPPVVVDDVKILPGKHNVIAVDAPQGSLTLLVGGSPQVSYRAILRKTGQMETLTTQAFGNTEKYLVGNYDLEILSLPRIFISNVEIKQSHNTRVEVPQPGIAVIRLPAQGFARVLHEENNNLNLIHVLRENIQSETIYLQPGNYKVVFRPRAASQTNFSIERSFKIESGVSTMVNLNY